VPTERAVQRALRTVLAERTALIIAHRLSTVEIADRVLVLADGQVIEDGTPDDLVAGGDVFFAATGVTDGELLRGVRYGPRRVLTQSLSMRSKSGAVRIIEGRHHTRRSNLIRLGAR
jgi:fructose-1,6-bisphosphatase/sedoheptulose 1,7-bisphosphatase-like protein